MGDNMIDKENLEKIANRYGVEVNYKEKGCGGIIPETICVEVNKFEHFTDDELYILKRQAIESSWEICSCCAYTEFEIRLHDKLMNEIIDEIKRREYGE